MSLLLQLLQFSLHLIWPYDVAYILYGHMIWHIGSGSWLLQGCFGAFRQSAYSSKAGEMEWTTISWWVSVSPDGMNYDRLSEFISWESHVCPLLFNCSLIYGNLDWLAGSHKKEDVDTILFIHSFNPIILLPFRQLFVHSYRRRALPMVFSSSFTPSSVFSVLSLSLFNPPLPLPL